MVLFHTKDVVRTLRRSNKNYTASGSFSRENCVVSCAFVDSKGNVRLFFRFQSGASFSFLLVEKLDARKCDAFFQLSFVIKQR